MKRVLLALVLVILLASLVACGGRNKATEEPGPQATPTAEAGDDSASTPTPGQVNPPAATATPTSAPTAEPTATPVPQPVATEAGAEEPLLTPEQLASVDQLDSYQSTTTLTTQGEDDSGNVENSSMEIFTQYTRDPLARRVEMTFTDAGSTAPTNPTPESLVFYQVDDGFYANMGQEGWVRLGAENTPFGDPDTAFLMNSGVLFSDLEDLQRLRPDQAINGIDSQHYSFDQRSISRLLNPEAGAATAKGEVWIAKDGGFVTKYVLDITVESGGADTLAPGITQGNVRMEFELDQVNGDLVIELPEEATTGTSLGGFDGDFPMPEDGSITLSSADLIGISTALAPEDAQAFYEDALSGMGWTKNEDSSMSMGSFVSLEFDKDSYTLSLLISPDESSGQTQIMATVETGQ